MIEELKKLLRETTVEELIVKYDVEITEGTMIINKKIPVKDFVRLKTNIRKRMTIDNIIVDADKWNILKE